MRATRDTNERVSMSNTPSNDEFDKKYASLQGGTGCPKRRPDRTLSFEPKDLTRPYTKAELNWMHENWESITPPEFW